MKIFIDSADLTEIRDAAVMGFIDGVTIPWVVLIIVVILAVVAAVIAALYPAYKASRMNVLEAIATE